MMPAASAGAMNIDMSGTASPPAPCPKPPFEMAVTRMATAATG